MSRLRTEGLSVRIGERTVLDALDLNVPGGGRLAILGRNGAGKSTLLSTLAGLRPAAAGRVLFGETDVSRMSARQAALARAWLSQFQGDAFASSVLETAMTGRHPHLGRWEWESARDEDLARSALESVGLAEWADRSVQTLSGGERQRLAIATLLTQDAPLYLLDEPLAHLDLNHQMAVLSLFAETARQQQAAVVMVLHDPALAYRFCDQALLLYGDGRLELGTVDAVLTAEKLSTLYGYPLRQKTVDAHRYFIPE